MSLIFRSKNTSDEAARKKQVMSSNEKMMVAGVITIVLVLAAGLVLLTSGGGTPLTRCTGIVFSTQRSSCLVSLAESTSNASVCGYLPSGQDAQCVSNIAVATKNESACGVVSSNESSYSGCVIAVSTSQADVSYCSSLSEPYKSNCVYGVAAQQNFMESSSCSLIGNQTLAANCQYRNDFQNALAYKQATYCSPLPSGQNSSLLAYMFAQTPIASGIANVTALLPFINVTPIQFCQYNVAVLTYNSTACSALGGTVSLLCQRAFSSNIYYNTSANLTQQNVTTLCGTLPSSVQQACSYGLLTYIATKNRNLTICGQIGSSLYANACYSSLAGKYHDDQYCTYITNASAMALCSSSASTNSTG